MQFKIRLSSPVFLHEPSALAGWATPVLLNLTEFLRGNTRSTLFIANPRVPPVVMDREGHKKALSNVGDCSER
jgi:hypothetical protein